MLLPPLPAAAAVLGVDKEGDPRGGEAEAGRGCTADGTGGLLVEEGAAHVGEGGEGQHGHWGCWCNHHAGVGEGPRKVALSCCYCCTAGGHGRLGVGRACCCSCCRTDCCCSVLVLLLVLQLLSLGVGLCVLQGHP